jgi:transcriptional regulator with PAS, ATPase and Fis domain
VATSICEVVPDPELQATFARLGFLTASGTMMPLLRRALKAAQASDVTVLLEGETGTGKQILAHAIHQLDQKRANFRFVTAHCGTISEGLAESELFGHRRGAFTGSVGDRSGLFQAAEAGTLFLDDVNDLSLSLQPKLLDVIQRGVLRPVGSDQEIRVNVRLIAASNQPLKPLVLQGRFRSDLYYRLNAIHLRLHPLRERPDDIADLVLAFAKRYKALYEPILKVEPDLVAFLKAEVFSGNVRELEHAVSRMLFLKSGGTSLGLDDWHAQAGEDKTDPVDLIDSMARTLWQAISQRRLSFSQAIRQIESKVLEVAVKNAGRTRRELAKSLQTSERTLYHKLRALHLK